MAIIAVGLALAGLHLRMYRFVQRRMDRLEDRIADHERRSDERFEAIDWKADNRFEAADRKEDERFAELKREMGQRFIGLNQETDKRSIAVDKRLGTIERALAELRERMARLEGLLDGLRESVVRPVA